MNAGGFSDVQPSALGKTTINDYKMMLNQIDITPPSTITGEIAPKNKNFDDLFYASVPAVDVNGLRQQQTVLFDFTKVTTRFDCQFIGVGGIPPSAAGGMPIRVYITAKNNEVLYNNPIAPSSRLMRYDPQSETFDGTVQSSKIKSMRLDLARTVDMPMLLNVEQAATGKAMMPPMNLQTYIPYPTQEQVDMQDQFVLRFDVTPKQNDEFAIVVTINGFSVITLDPITE
jgi:hypothetical protein